MVETTNIHGTDGGCITEGLPDPAAYVRRWDHIKATVTDLRILAAMWDAPKERAARQQIRALLSRPSGDGR